MKNLLKTLGICVSGIVLGVLVAFAVMMIWDYFESRNAYDLNPGQNREIKEFNWQFIPYVSQNRRVEVVKELINRVIVNNVRNNDGKVPDIYIYSRGENIERNDLHTTEELKELRDLISKDMKYDISILKYNNDGAIEKILIEGKIID